MSWLRFVVIFHGTIVVTVFKLFIIFLILICPRSVQEICYLQEQAHAVSLSEQVGLPGLKLWLRLGDHVLIFSYSVLHVLFILIVFSLHSSRRIFVLLLAYRQTYIVLLRKRICQLILSQEVGPEKSDRIVFLGAWPKQLTDFTEVEVETSIDAEGTFALHGAIKVEFE